MENSVAPVNWEAVRALAMVVGVREAARRMEINEETVKKRCTRERWLASSEAQRANRIARDMRSGVTVSPQLSPAALVASELQQLGNKSRLSLARGIAKAGEHIEQMQPADIVQDANNVKAIAQTADIVHGFRNSAPNVKIRIGVLAAPQEQPVIDVESETIEDVSPTDSLSSELDEY